MVAVARSGQVVATVQALEAGGDPVVVAINAASAALCVSNIPWDGPAGCVRIGAFFTHNPMVNKQHTGQTRGWEEEGEQQFFALGWFLV